MRTVISSKSSYGEGRKYDGRRKGMMEEEHSQSKPIDNNNKKKYI